MSDDLECVSLRELVSRSSIIALVEKLEPHKTFTEVEVEREAPGASPYKLWLWRYRIIEVLKAEHRTFTEGEEIEVASDSWRESLDAYIESFTQPDVSYGRIFTEYMSPIRLAKDGQYRFRQSGEVAERFIIFLNQDGAQLTDAAGHPYEAEHRRAEIMDAITNPDVALDAGSAPHLPNEPDAPDKAPGESPPFASWDLPDPFN